MENIIECVCRRYRIQTPGGTVVDVETDKPLSQQMNLKLLEEDSDIDEFFKTHRILGTRYKVQQSPQRTTDLGEPKILTKSGGLSPRQRLNQLLKMKGEFTRNDYIKFLFDSFQYKLNKWTSHNDIKDAIRLNKIQLVEHKGRGKERIYKIVDTEEIGESLYETFLQDRKLQISTLT